MKSIKDFLNPVNERRDIATNFYIMKCGAMNEYKKDLVQTINSTKGLVNVYLFDKDEIIHINEDNINDVHFDGPHIDNFDDVVKETKKHLGELSFIITC